MNIFKVVIIIIVALVFVYQLIMLFGISVTGRIDRIDDEYYTEYFSEESMRERLEIDYHISDKKIDEIVSSPEKYTCVYCTIEIHNSTMFKIYNLFLSFRNLWHKGEIITPIEWEHFCWRTIEPHETYKETVLFLAKKTQLHPYVELKEELSGCCVGLFGWSNSGVFASFRPMIKII